MTERLDIIDAHPAVYLFQNYLAMPRMLHTLRSSLCYKATDQLVSFVKTIKRTASVVCNVDFDDIEWKRALLPIYLSIIGLATSIDTTFPAYAAYLIVSNERTSRIISNISESDLSSEQDVVDCRRD